MTIPTLSRRQCVSYIETQNILDLCNPQDHFRAFAIFFAFSKKHKKNLNLKKKQKPRSFNVSADLEEASRKLKEIFK